jgi:hypothetical protein
VTAKRSRPFDGPSDDTRPKTIRRKTRKPPSRRPSGNLQTIDELRDVTAYRQPSRTTTPSIIAELRFHRNAQTVHRFGARVVYELLAEIGRRKAENACQGEFAFAGNSPPHEATEEPVTGATSGVTPGVTSAAESETETDDSAGC